ncbi:type II asparaginase [Chitinivorax sp. B]|uniref:type II asparaginase n=1 Tax=Chitinivorax sp. B TaxID=2502235 RepID=UPI0010F8165C|nr:type II asparaginase [Chitinivorax sp. B]
MGALFCAAAIHVQAEPVRPMPNIIIVATGGTIAGAAASSTATVGYEAGKIGVDQLIDAVPEIKKISQVRAEQLFRIGSENMNNDHWLKLAKRINVLAKQNDVDGIVITHGTDTLEETAYFLNLVVKSKKPIVLVGSMRPATAMSADGPLNLYNAVILAGSKEAVGKGVLVSLNDEVSAARDVTKASTMLVNTFRSPELGALGYIQDGRPYFYRQPSRKHTTESEFDISDLESLPAVDVVYAYANSNRVALDAFVKAGVKGVIHAGMGNGSFSEPMKAGLIDARKEGVVVVRSSRVGNGVVARNGEARDDELDFVVSDSLNPQKARVLLMLALTKTTSTKDIQRMFYSY